MTDALDLGWSCDIVARPPMLIRSEQELQRRHYAQTAAAYDGRNGPKDEHYVALGFMVGMLDYLDATSVLDIGSGTGRTLKYLQQHAPEVRRRGIEPVDELRSIAYDNGVSPEELTRGDGAHLPFADGEFDVVSEFAVLHHVRHPESVVREMLRVARKAIFISDCNRFGQGTFTNRVIKQLLGTAKLWPLANLLKTLGKGYDYNENEGIFYSYSVFDNYDLVRTSCRRVHTMNTVSAGTNPYRTASHVALLGIK
jgi:ubiquinone/menaquinone biosynthesis C-methylase UbiE